jgi:hypothetical protein
MSDIAIQVRDEVLDIIWKSWQEWKAAAEAAETDEQYKHCALMADALLDLANKVGQITIEEPNRP